MPAIFAGSVQTHTTAINIQAAHPTAAARVRWQSQAILARSASCGSGSAVAAGAKVVQDSSADVSTVPVVSLTRPDCMPTASSPDWSFRVNFGRSFDVAPHSASRPRPPARAFHGLATELDCLAVRGSVLGPSERSRRGHPPCVSYDALRRPPATTLVPADSSRPGENGADNDYRTFKPSQSVFNESPLPDEVPQANRALEKWIVPVVTRLLVAFVRPEVARHGR